MCCFVLAHVYISYVSRLYITWTVMCVLLATVTTLFAHWVAHVNLLPMFDLSTINSYRLYVICLFKTVTCLLTGEASWERTSTCRSYGGRSSLMWWGFCSAWGVGSTVSCLPSTGLLDPPDPTKPADWDTRPNRVSDETATSISST